MKKFFSIFIVLVIFSEIEKVSTGEVSCEKIESEGWNDVGNIKVCFMTKTTSINAPGFTISSARDETITVLRFSDNKKIIFLPERVAEKFPKLVALSAGWCSIKSISKENFEGMKSLRFLRLFDNQIEKIQTGTFDDLISLEHLDLRDNKIKFLNSEVFRNLHKLEEVWFSGNKCINEDFLNEPRIALLRQRVQEKCGFNETSEIIEETKVVDKNTQEKSTETTSANDNKASAEIGQILSDLKTLIADKDKNIIDELKTKVIKLESQLEEKKKEMSELEAKIRAKDVENADLKNKIAGLNKEIAEFTFVC